MESTEEKVIEGQEESTPNKYQDLNDRIEAEFPTEKEAEKEVETEKEAEAEKEVETEKEAEKEVEKKSIESDEEQIQYDDTKLIVSKGEDKKELVKVDLGDDKIAFVPEELKSGYLMQSDYTKKTMALAEERRQFEEQTKTIQQQSDEVFKLKYADVLGQEFNEPKPLESDFLNDDRYDTVELAKEAYRKADTEWFNKRDVHTQNRGILNARIAEVTQINQKNFNAFKEKYGEENFTKVYEKVQKYINPFVFRNIDSFPDDALELLHKGMNYDADLKKAQSESAVKTVEKLNQKQKTAVKLDSATTQVHKTPDTTYDNMPERYKILNKKIDENK